jgi:xylulokinase
MSVVFVADLGGTHFRAALIDRHGAVVAQSSRASAPSEVDADGRSEVAPDNWWQTLLALAADLAESAPEAFAATQAIALSAVTRTQVLIDAHGHVLRDALTWRDTRAASIAEELAAQLPPHHPETAQVNAFHPLARLAWLKRHEPDRFSHAATVLEPKDYLNFCLTGVRLSDRISSARLNAAATRTESAPDLLEASGIPHALLPPLATSCDEVGTIRADAPAPFGQLAGIPVMCGSNDTWSAVVGLGALQPNVAYNLSGTTEVFGVISTDAHSAAGLVSVDWGGVHQLGGPSQNGADTLAWLLSILGLTHHDGPFPADALTALLAAPRHPQPLLFLPYLQGERVPWWDAALRGAFIGLQRAHTPTDMAWAVLEGVAFHNRLVLNRAEAALGRHVDEIRFGGKAASNLLWRQIKADICERPVVVGTAAEAGLTGAAAVAWTGIGAFASLRDAQRHLARSAARCEPDATRVAFYRPLFELYQQAHSALAPISRELAALPVNRAAPQAQ